MPNGQPKFNWQYGDPLWDLPVNWWRQAQDWWRGRGAPEYAGRGMVPPYAAPGPSRADQYRQEVMGQGAGPGYPTRGSTLPTMPTRPGAATPGLGAGGAYGTAGLYTYNPNILRYMEGATAGTPAAGMTYQTPVEAALATVGRLAATAPEPEPEQRYYQPLWPGERGYWAAIGQEPGEYQVPQGALTGMPGWRRQAEEWSWSTRGIPLQGYEIFRISRGQVPWGRGGGGGGGRRSPRPEKEETPPWQPGSWSWTF